jgi:hypothetical protein
MLLYRIWPLYVWKNYALWWFPSPSSLWFLCHFRGYLGWGGSFVAWFVILRVFFSGFLWGDHGWVPCFSLWMMLTPQTSGIAFDLQFSGRAQGGALCAQVLRFRLIGLVWGHKILGIASPRDTSHLRNVGLNPSRCLGDPVYGVWSWPCGFALVCVARHTLTVRLGPTDYLSWPLFVQFIVCSSEFFIWSRAIWFCAGDVWQKIRVQVTVRIGSGVSGGFVCNYGGSVFVSQTIHWRAWTARDLLIDSPSWPRRFG